MEDKNMIKRVKELRPDAEIASPKFRDFLEKFESEINRGISTLCVLSIINQFDEIGGTYGYQILKDLEDQTNEMLVIEEKTLYPLLRNLERDGLIESKKETTGRRKKFYFMTEEGKKILNYLTGYYSKLTKALSRIIDINVELKNKYIYCPMCANKMDLSKNDYKYCPVCGYNMEQDLKQREV
jgi:PadR family transcriptional regulator PadR